MATAAFAQAVQVDPCSGKLPPQFDAAPPELKKMLLSQMAAVCEESKKTPPKPVHDTADTEPAATHTHWTYASAFTPDGRRMISAGFDKTVRLWDAATGKHLRVVGYTKDRPRYLALSPDGRRVAVSVDGDGVRIFDVESGAHIGAVDYQPADKLRSGAAPVVYDRAGRLITPINGNELGVFPPDLKGSPVRIGPHAGEIRSLAVSHAAGAIITGDQRGFVRTWSLETGQPAGAIGLVNEEIRGLAPSPDGTRLAAVYNGTVAILGLNELRQTVRIVVDPMFVVFAVAFTPDGESVITCRNRPQLWSAKSGEKIRDFGTQEDLCHSISVTADGKYFLTTHMTADLRLWETATGTFYRRFGRYDPTRR